MIRLLPLTSALFALTFLGCAPHYSLKPTSEKPENLNGVPVETLVAPKCVLQAGFQTSTSEELLVHVKLLNKSNAAFDFDPTSFSLIGPPNVVKNSPLRALNPEQHIRELNASADLFDSRTHMESYQGIDDLSTLNTGTSDSELEEARQQYRAKKDEAESARKSAADLRARSALIGTVALKKSSLKPGESVEGAIVFKVSFMEKGPVSILLDHPSCTGKLDFLLDK